MTLILEHKIQILLFSEILAWILLLPMFYFRHWSENKSLFMLFLFLSGFFGYIPHLGIPILACITKGSLMPLYDSKESVLFILLIFLIFILGATKGKSLVKKIDKFMYEKAQKMKTKKNKSIKSTY